jgi:signal transduction histidine kinase
MDGQVPAAQALSAAPGGSPDALETAVAELADSFSTPLTAIVGFAELLRTRDSEHVRREAPRHIQEEAESLLRELDVHLQRVRAGAGSRQGADPSPGRLPGQRI